MILLLTYDISLNKNRSRVHHFLKEFGLNTQKSVFECDLDATALKQVVRYGIEHTDAETDSIRIYRVCSNCLRKVMISGQGVRLTRMNYMVL